MVKFKWHKHNSVVFGNSICGKYEAEVKPQSHSFEYEIKETKNNRIINHGVLKASDINEAINVVTAITTLKYAI